MGFWVISGCILAFIVGRTGSSSGLYVCFSIIGFVVQGATRLFREVDTFMSIPKLLQRSA